LYEKVHEFVWIKLNESKCTVKEGNFNLLFYQSGFILSKCNDKTPTFYCHKFEFHIYSLQNVPFIKTRRNYPHRLQGVRLFTRYAFRGSWSVPAPGEVSLVTCLAKTWGCFTLLPLTESFWLSSFRLLSFLTEKEVEMCLFCHPLYLITVAVYTFILLETFWRNMVWLLTVPINVFRLSFISGECLPIFIPLEKLPTPCLQFPIILDNNMAHARTC
jgi:hypothetical protein